MYLWNCGGVNEDSSMEAVKLNSKDKNILSQVSKRKINKICKILTYESQLSSLNCQYSVENLKKYQKMFDTSSLSN